MLIGKTAKAIIDILRDNPLTTIEELRTSLGKQASTIKEHLNNLQSKGIIRRVGPDKGGHWEVNITK